MQNLTYILYSKCDNSELLLMLLILNFHKRRLLTVKILLKLQLSIILSYNFPPKRKQIIKTDTKLEHKHIAHRFILKSV